MTYFNKENDYPLNLIEELKTFPWDVDMKMVEENFDSILLDYFKQPNCFLNEREQTIILGVYKEGRTLQDLANQFNLTRERVRQIKVKSIRKLFYHKSIFYTDFDEYLAIQKEYKRKREELCDKIVELDRLLIEAGKLLATNETTIREIKEFLDASSEEQRDIITRNSDISELDLSVRSYNCLKRARINTIKELSELTHEKLMKIRNLGRKSQKEIIEKLRELGIELEEE
jgi:DNA-directed RNA polymerase sigma subunit (sigma70/sigma32)